MYRVRLHGRGGQGINTASRILGTAFFLSGYELQDTAGSTGERYGIPLLAYVRASRNPIYERGMMRQAELVIVTDDSLIGIPTCGVLNDFSDDTVLMIFSNTDATSWRSRLNLNGRLIVLPPNSIPSNNVQFHYTGTACASAAAQLLGVITRDTLQLAIDQELAEQYRRIIVDRHIAYGLSVFDTVRAHKACVKPSRRSNANHYQAPTWINLALEAPHRRSINAPGKLHNQRDRDNSEHKLRPVVNYDQCQRCWWLCSHFCPHDAIHNDNGNFPRIDYEHCTACLVCMGQCPRYAISANMNTEDFGHSRQGRST